MTDWPSYVGWYVRRHMVRTPGHSTPWRTIHAGWLAWWQSPAWWTEPPTEQPTMREFGLALLAICQLNGVQVIRGGDDACCVGLRMVPPKPTSWWGRVRRWLRPPIP
jgi:hypothetical protein